ASDFSGTLTSSTTAVAPATVGLIAPLSINTTYYGEVKGTLSGVDSDWSLSVATATLAVPPTSQSSTWTAVNFTSVTVQWASGANPASVTLYEVRIGTTSNYSGTETPAFTRSLTNDFVGLTVATTYYARVRAINHSGIPTLFTDLGSTVTVRQSAPT